MLTYQSYIIALHTDTIDDSGWNQYFDIETNILNKHTPMLPLPPTRINKKQINLDEDIETDNKGTDNKGTDNKGTDNKEMPIEQKNNHFINFQYLIISSIFYISHLAIIIFILVV
jgi:hypothetical protein